MTGPDDEFDDFLKRRKPVFRRADDEMFEPPAELDRVVLRQAREAIEADRTHAHVPCAALGHARSRWRPRWCSPSRSCSARGCRSRSSAEARGDGAERRRARRCPCGSGRRTAATEVTAVAQQPWRSPHRRASRHSAPQTRRALPAAARVARATAAPRWPPPPAAAKPARHLPGAAIRNPGRRKSSDCAMRVTRSRRRGIRGIQAPATRLCGRARPLNPAQRGSPARIPARFFRAVRSQ